MTRDDLLQAYQNPNVLAFLRVIRAGESSQDDSAYTVLYGGGHFEGFADHPRQHFPVGNTTTSAAGAYQFEIRTWDDVAKRFGLVDFSPPCQDLGAIAKIADRHALDDVIAGRLDAAIRKLPQEWTSLALAARQKAAAAIFQQYGGTLAETQTTTPQVKPMGILAAILPTLFQAAPDLIRLLGGGEQSQKNAAVAQKVADVAVQVTGSINEQEAASKIANDPAAAQAFRDAVAQNFDQWMGMMVKFAEIDAAAKEKTRDFLTAYDRTPVAGRFTFVELLSLSMVLASMIGGGFVLWDPLGKFTTEMQTAVVMLMLIGGWNGVKEFWLGDSAGSRKDAAAAPSK